tara:strand:- start:957 stop:2429 length:1473 start_codon:yes stop_codon:yes gene_type:complete
VAKVLLINPVIRFQDKPRHVPYGLAQLSAIIRNEGHQLQVFDANAWRPTDEEIKSVLRADNWDVIATGGLVTTYGFIKKLVRYARQESPASLIVVGGGLITPIPYDIMHFLPDVDVGIVGEGYVTFPEVLLRVDDGRDKWDDIHGIIWRDSAGRGHLNPERPLINNLDSLPFPAWDLFPVDIYFRGSSLLLSEEGMLSKRRLEIVCSYGCRFSCKFCFHLGLSGELTTKKRGDGELDVFLTHKRKTRAHSPEYIIALVKKAKDEFDIDFVTFLDENFAGLANDKEWYDKFSSLWKQAGFQPECVKQNKDHDSSFCKGIHWGTTAHAAQVNMELLKRMRDIGCSHLDYGLESFSDEILKSLGKGSSSRKNEAAVVMTLKAGIRPIPNQIIGFPDESFESIKTSVKAWERLGIRNYPFMATPYPGSEWYFTFKEEILEQYSGNLEEFLLDLADATNITAVISKNFNAVELLGLRELMVSRDIKRIKDYERNR